MIVPIEVGAQFPFSSFVVEPESIPTFSPSGSRDPSSVETSPAATADEKKRQSRNNCSPPTGSFKVADQDRDLQALAVTLVELRVTNPHTFDPEKTGTEKNTIRTGHWPLNSKIRPKLWHQLYDLNFNKCQSNHSANDIIYSDGLKSIFGEKDVNSGSYRTQSVELPSFVDKDYIHQRHLSPEGVLAAHRVAKIISFYHPDITYCPLLYPMVVINLHVFTEDNCFRSVKILLDRKKPLSYLTQTRQAFKVMVEVFKLLAKEYCKASFNFLKSQETESEKVFESWLSWIFVHLPFYHVVRVIDCYLYEGPKVLYRVGLAILSLFHKNRAEISKTQSSNVKIEEFCSSINFSPCKLLKTAFGFKNLSKSGIQKMMDRVLKKGIPHSSHTLQRSNSLGLVVSNELQLPESMVMNQKQWEHIYNMLPVRIRVKRPRLLFSTSEDGCSLKTFYNKVDGQDPTLLIIKTIDKEIVGAYCTGDWNERKPTDRSGLGLSSAVSSKYFGSGENFVFRLFPEPAIVFSWAGLSQTSSQENKQHVGDGGCLARAEIASEVIADGDESADLAETEWKRKQFRMYFFVTGNNTSISVGGGSKGPALFIDENFSNVTSSPSDTFNNHCLLSKISPRPIVTFEAFGFE